MSITLRPIVLLCPARSVEAEPCRTNPSSLMAASTRSRVAGATLPGRFSTLETVPGETPASAATSLMLTMAMKSN
ncbi:hypothetical protein GCM10020001_009290 [Nonomuraea salmonea]